MKRIGAAVLGLLIGAAFALADGPSRERLSAPPSTSYTGTSPIVVSGSTISATCAGAGQSGPICTAGAAGTPLSLDAGINFTQPTGSVNIQHTAGAKECFKAAGLNCLTSDGTYVSLPDGRLNGNNTSTYLLIDVNNGAGVSYRDFTTFFVDSSSGTLSCSNLPDSAAARCLTVNTGNQITLDGGHLLTVKNASATVSRVDPRGMYGVYPENADGGIPDNAPLVRGNVNTQQVIEFGSSTFSTGSKAITFNTPFRGSSVPNCMCSDSAGSTLACAHGTCTASACTFFGTVSDAFDWFCIGQR